MRCITIDDNYPVSSFDTDAKKGGIALIHSPSCGHCIAMKDEWDAFEKDIPNFQNSISGEPNIFRISANTVGNLGHGIANAVRGVPTILIIKPGATVGKIYDSNERTKQNFVDFFKEGFPKSSALTKRLITSKKSSGKKTHSSGKKTHRRSNSHLSSDRLIISGGGKRKSCRKCVRKRKKNNKTNRRKKKKKTRKNIQSNYN